MAGWARRAWDAIVRLPGRMAAGVPWAHLTIWGLGAREARDEERLLRERDRREPRRQPGGEPEWPERHA
jgi:hypothetical protein